MTPPRTLIGGKAYLRGLLPQMAIAIQIAAEVFARFDFPCRLTSACGDKGHSIASLHYAGAAIDLGLAHVIDETTRANIHGAIKEQLGPEFDVVLESTHVHVEWQPKRRSL